MPQPRTFSTPARAVASAKLQQNIANQREWEARDPEGYAAWVAKVNADADRIHQRTKALR